jgi:LPS-assembly lipoprotein
MRLWTRTAVAIGMTLVAAGMVAGCGFRPLYAPIESGGQLAAISVAEIEGKTGHVLKAQLERLMAAGRPAGAQSTHRLVISLEERLETLGLRVDSSATRTDLILTATYTLLDASGQEAAKGRLETAVSYDVPLNAFGEFSAQNDARERAGETMAELLRADLAARLTPKP